VDCYDHRRAPLRDAPVRTANFPQCASEKQTAWRENKPAVEMTLRIATKRVASSSGLESTQKKPRDFPRIPS